MTITDLVHLAEAIHNAEGWDLGSPQRQGLTEAQAREIRNTFWARVIGCAYHGHPRYNPVPDRQWHLKRADAHRPQTDDVATSMPSRNHWDCIPGAGADGYRFEATPHGPLPEGQIVYAPPMPSDVIHTPEPVPSTEVVFPPRDETMAAFNAINVRYGTKGRQNRVENGDPLYIDNEGITVWLQQYLLYRVNGQAHDAAMMQVIADIDNAWR